MAPTFKKIQTIEVGAGGSASIDFTSIPSTYTDLIIKLSVRDASTASYANDINIKVNGATTSLSARLLYGTGSAVASTTNPTWIANANANSSTASTFGNAELYFTNYAASANKSFSVDSVTENNATNALAMLAAGLYSSSTAITSIGFTLAGGTNFAQYSSATLYGIKNS